MVFGKDVIIYNYNRFDTKIYFRKQYNKYIENPGVLL